MAISPIFRCNRNGIPMIASKSVTVGIEDVRINFNSHPFAGVNFTGFFVVKLSQVIPAGTTTALPIVFTTDGNNAINLTTYNNANVTVADITGTGIYLCFYDASDNVVQLIS